MLPGSTLITTFPFTPNVQTYFLKQQGCRNDPLPNAWFGNQLIVACSGLKDFDPIQFMDIWIANQDRKSVSPVTRDDTPDISKIEHWFLGTWWWRIYPLSLSPVFAYCWMESLICLCEYNVFIVC